jgi:hypothetical protein
MGYAYYTITRDNGEVMEAGYGVEAECEKPGCTAVIDRGLGYLCGNNPDGWRDPSEPGCGGYFCLDHGGDHNCPNVDTALCGGCGGCGMVGGMDGEELRLCGNCNGDGVITA